MVFLYTLEYYSFSGHLYEELYRFVTSAEFDLVFDLNEMLRDGQRWYPGNAHKLMEYTVKKGYQIAGWELGNGKSTILK